MMTTKTLLNSEVWTTPNLDHPKGVCYGRVIKQTAKTIWIEDQFGTEKWNKKSGDLYRCVKLNIERKFIFDTDPFMDFMFGKKAA